MSWRVGSPPLKLSLGYCWFSPFYPRQKMVGDPHPFSTPFIWFPSPKHSHGFFSHLFTLPSPPPKENNKVSLSLTRPPKKFQVSWDASFESGISLPCVVCEWSWHERERWIKPKFPCHFHLFKKKTCLTQHQRKDMMLPSPGNEGNNLI